MTKLFFVIPPPIRDGGHLSYTVLAFTIFTVSSSTTLDTLSHWVNILHLCNEFQSQLHTYLADVNVGQFSNDSVSELRQSSVYDSLNQLYTQINGLLDSLDNAGKYFSTLADTTWYEGYVNVNNLLVDDCNEILRILRRIEPLINSYNFFTEPPPPKFFFVFFGARRI